MEPDQPEKNWKLKLRYGKLKTPYRHFSAIAEGVVGELSDGFSCRAGSAFMGMNTWSSSADESADMIRVIGRRIGFVVTGKIHIFETDPKEPPKDTPYGYEIKFTPFDPAA
jgi:hypothetical protein